MFYLIVFSNSQSPIYSFVFVLGMQLVFGSCLLLLLGFSDRRLWVKLVQELFLIFFFFGYSSCQNSFENNFVNSYSIILYLLGLSISLNGLLFDIVDKNKKHWIDKAAWKKPNHNKK